MIGSNRKAVTRTFAEVREGGCAKVKSRRVYAKDFDAARRDAGKWVANFREIPSLGTLVNKPVLGTSR